MLISGFFLLFSGNFMGFWKVFESILVFGKFFCLENYLCILAQSLNWIRWLKSNVYCMTPRSIVCQPLIFAASSNREYLPGKNYIIYISYIPTIWSFYSSTKCDHHVSLSSGKLKYSFLSLYLYSRDSRFEISHKINLGFSKLFQPGSWN